MSRQHQKGITLIEILVATAVGAVILAGVVQLFIGMKQSEQLSISLARLQENGRFAVDILSREFRMVGYTGCSDPMRDFIPVGNILAINFPLTKVSSQAVEGTTASDTGEAELFDGATTISDAVPGTDVVAIAYASPHFASLAADMVSPSDDINLGSSQTRFVAEEALLISNCSADGQFVFRASEVSEEPPYIIKHDATMNTNAEFGAISFEAGHTVRRIVLNTYYIRLNPRGIRSLYRKTANGTVDEIIEGVDNFKLLYAYYDDNNTNNIQNDDSVQWLTAEEINGSASYHWSRVASIKAAVLLSGEQEVLHEDGPATYDMLGSNVAAPATDKRLRRVFATTVKVRNRELKGISM